MQATPAFESPNSHLLARHAQQQHSVRQPFAAPAADAALQQSPAAQSVQAVGEGAAAPGGGGLRWWQDPKMTFGPPGDPEFLAMQAAQEQVRSGASEYRISD